MILTRAGALPELLVASVRPLGEDMDEDDPVAGLKQVVDRPPRGGLAGRRVVHAHANGALLGSHAGTCCEFLVEFAGVRRLWRCEAEAGREKEGGAGRPRRRGKLYIALSWEEFGFCSELEYSYRFKIVGVEPNIPY